MATQWNGGTGNGNQTPVTDPGKWECAQGIFSEEDRNVAKVLPLQVVGSGRVSLSGSGSVLTIAEVILSDSGVYTCNTSNNYGTAEADFDILLMVYCKSLHRL